MRYCVNIKGARVRVTRYEGEADYSAEVQRTFAKFAANAVKDYWVGFRNWPDMNHVEARILDLVARLYPDVFQALDEFCARHAAYLDDTIRVFDREVQFYAAYLDFTAPMKEAGLDFCYPAVSRSSKQISARSAVDLALAAKLMPLAATVVSNDFYLDGPERIFLMYPDRDFDLDRDLPPNEAELSGDLELDVLLRAMASGDKFLFDVARQGIHSRLTDPAEIVYRQHVLADCIGQPGVVRDLYDVAVAAIAGEKKILGWLFRDSPETIVHRTRQLLRIYVDMFRRLRDIADAHAASFRSEGFTQFFAMIARELGDEYLAGIEAQIGELAFRRGTLISARLGTGSKGTGYILRRQPGQGWRDRIPGLNRSGYSFIVPDRDESGMRTLSDLTSRGLNGAANALAQSADHIRAFFEMLRAELAFYLGCLNLQDQLTANGGPVCFPVSASPVSASRERARLSARGLYDRLPGAQP